MSSVQFFIRKDQKYVIATPEELKQIIFRCVTTGNLKKLKYYIDSGANYDECNLIYIACINGNLDIVKYLFSKTKNKMNLIKFKNVNKCGFLNVVTEQNYNDLVKFLVNEGCKVDGELVRVASQNGNLKLVQFFVSQGAMNIITKNEYEHILSCTYDYGQDFLKPAFTREQKFKYCDYEHRKVIEFLEVTSGLNKKFQ